MGAEFLRTLVMWVWLSGFATGVGAAPADSDAKAEPAEPEFAGKVVAIAMKNGSGCFLENIETRKLGSTTFLVGRIADSGTGPMPALGSTLWIATDNITQMVEFKSLEEAKKLYQSQASTTTPASYPAPMPARYSSPLPVTPAQYLQRVASPVGDGDVQITPEKSFLVPLLPPIDRPSPPLASTDTVRVHVSSDQGKTWVKHKEVSSTDICVSFTAPEDGEYWFAFQVISRDGKKSPADLKNLKPSSKFRVKTPEVDPSRFNSPGR